MADWIEIAKALDQQYLEEEIKRYLELGNKAYTEDAKAYLISPGIGKPQNHFLKIKLYGETKSLPLKTVARMAIYRKTKSNPDRTSNQFADIIRRKRFTFEGQPITITPDLTLSGSTAPSPPAYTKVQTRPEQSKFRSAVLELFHGACAVTKCNIETVLEAAHIVEHSKERDDNAAENGILLRADIHRLFDAHLIRIEPDTGRLEFDSAVKSAYADEVGSWKTRIPALDATRLRKRYEA